MLFGGMVGPALGCGVPLLLLWFWLTPTHDFPTFRNPASPSFLKTQDHEKAVPHVAQLDSYSTGCNFLKNLRFKQKKKGGSPPFQHSETWCYLPAAADFADAALLPTAGIMPAIFMVSIRLRM
jgi:hypothetical protein